MKNGRNAALNGGRGSGQTVRRISEMYEAKIADLKANADFAIEGRDMKIDELEEQNSQMFNTIALQEQQIEKMKCCENCRWLWLKEQNETVIACSSCKDKNMWRLKND